MVSCGRKVTTNSDRSNFYPVIVIATTGFTELPLGEALSPVNSKTIGLEEFLDTRDTIYGDDNIVTIDAYLTCRERLNSILYRLSTCLTQRGQDDCRESHHLDREAQGRPHRSKLPK
jgi:hypothetical protein